MTTREDAHPPIPGLLGSCRLTITVMCFLAAFACNMISTSFSFALVCMNNCNNNDNYNSSDNSDNYTTSRCNETTSSVQVSQWSPEIRGILLGANFYGVVATQLLGGWINDKLRKSKVFLITGVTINSLATIFIPFVMETGVGFVIALRIVAGMGGGFYYSSLMPILRSWITPREQGFLVGFAFAGSGFASTVAFPIASFICKYAGGWPVIFYFTGSCGLLWAFTAFFTVFDSPKNHPRISDAEKECLLSINQHSALKKKDVRVPWTKILTSVPVWAVVLTNFCWFAAYKTAIIYLPLLMRDALNFKVEENGLFSGLPSLCAFVSHMILGPFFDFLLRKKFCTITVLRKVFNSIGCFIPALAMYLASQLVFDHKYAIIALIAAAQGFGEFAATGGFMVTLLDLAPQYVGITQGINSTIGLSPGFLTPVVIAALTPSGSKGEWSWVFLLYGSLYAAAGLIYLVFGSSERQSWAANTNKSSKKMISSS